VRGQPKSWKPPARLVRLGVVAGLLAIVGVVALPHAGGQPARAAQALTISSDQPLLPAFTPAVHDYAVRCSGSPLVLSVDAPPSTAVSVDHSQMRSGSFQRAVPLAAGQEFSIAVRGNAITDDYYVRCLPPDFPTYTYTNQGNAPPGMFVVDGIGNYLALFDDNGVPVWWMERASRPIDSQVLADGTVAFYDTTADVNEIYSLAGQPIRVVSAVNGPTDVHELQLLPGGNYLVSATLLRSHVDLSSHAGPADTTVIDGEAEEVTPTGQLVWSWDSGDHLSLDDTPPRWYDLLFQGTAPYDVVHLNSLELHGNEVVISMRHTDAVWGVDRSTGQVLWKLGGTANPHSLTVTGDPDGDYPLGGQHDARILPDGTLTIHDNNTFLAPAPREVHYRLDETAHTATLLGQITDADMPSSICCGSARTLSSGDTLIAWGGSPLVALYDTTGNSIFKLTFDQGFMYRAIPVPASTTIADVRTGMNAQYPRVDDNLPPVASFGAAPNLAAVGAPVTLDGASSDDPDGTVVSYDWDFGDGSSGAGATATHSYSRPGDYLVRLTVHDDAGASDTTAHTVSVLAASPPAPIAVIDSASRVRSLSPVSFDGSSSQAPDSAIISYLWSFGDGGSARGPLVSHRYGHPGRYTVVLIVTNNSGVTAAARWTVTVTDRAPSGSFSQTPSRPRAGAAVHFTARTRDRDGTIVSYRWSFGDGRHTFGRRVEHTYVRAGTYLVKLSLTDDSGTTKTLSRKLRVS
jgi:PKD repeat protein